MSSNYQKGAAKERHVISTLKKEGCSYAARIAGSHSEFDVVAGDDRFVYFVQAKSTLSLPKGIVSIINAYKKDISQMEAVKLNKNSLKELWIYPFRKGPIRVNVFPVEFYQRI